jgi:hypothetical protein
MYELRPDFAPWRLVSALGGPSMKSQASWSFYLCQFSRNSKIEVCRCFAV